MRPIPEELIKHLEWTPGSELPTVLPGPSPDDSIDALIRRARIFFSDKRDDSLPSLPVGVADALEKAVLTMPNGTIASLPYLVAGKAKAGMRSYLWRKEELTALSEEDYGIDRRGKILYRGQRIVIVIHGGGILTHESIRQEYRAGQNEFFAKLSDEEFDGLLDGILPSGEKIRLYSTDDIRGGIPNPFGRFAVWLPYEIAIEGSENLAEEDFIKNDLVVARAGTLEYLGDYFRKAMVKKHFWERERRLRNMHYVSLDLAQPRGSLLHVWDDSRGFSHKRLRGPGTFVGVNFQVDKQ